MCVTCSLDKFFTSKPLCFITASNVESACEESALVSSGPSSTSLAVPFFTRRDFSVVGTRNAEYTILLLYGVNKITTL